MKELIKKILCRVVSPLFISNVFKTKFSRNVLICYITYPFYSRNTKKVTHSNYKEVRAIADSFMSFGYNVDVVDYRYDKSLMYQKYDIIFGFGDIYEKSFYDEKFEGISVHYLTGAYSIYQNFAEIRRVNNFNLLNDSKCIPKRINDRLWPNSIASSTAIIALGNSWTIATITSYALGKVFKLDTTNVEPVVDKNILCHKVYQAQNNFLWIGSTGSIHKGLDLCIDAVLRTPNVVLHVVGNIDSDFKEIYQDKFESSDQIISYGFLDVKSIAFEKVIRQCMFVIMPSCSEGMSTSVICGIKNGLIPIVTKQSGIDVYDYEGILIEELTTDAVINAIKKALAYTDEQLISAQKKCYDLGKSRHSIENFKNRVKAVIGTIVAKY